MSDSKRHAQATRDTVPSRMTSRFWLTGSVIIICSLFVLAGSRLVDSKPHGDMYEDAFANLERLREVKKREVIEHFDMVHRLARGVRNDPVMLRSFSLMSHEGYVQDDNLEYQLDRHYVGEYGDFYDILFVSAEGYVFHSIRKESDYHTNLFTGPLSDTKLVRQMKRSPGDHFVEYEYYSPSEEPAAFFASPLHDRGRHVGWFVLQCSINHLNTILTQRKGLGRTGEIYLVNKEKWMLTDSRFIEDCTSLRLKVDTQAAREALEKGIGSRIIQDYRDVKVLSAFERFDVFGTSWVVICEIDEDEVVTEHYTKYTDYYQKRIFDHLAYRASSGHRPELPDRKRVRVDLNEFAKAEVGTGLETYGVATCTAVAISYPGRFSYLAHIGPRDAIYADGKFPRILRRNGNSDFMGELIRRIQHYDVLPCELGELQFTIVASHDDSFGNAVQRILDAGVGIGNIKLVCNPKAGYANVAVDPTENKVLVVWTGGQLRDQHELVDAANVEDLGTIVRRLASHSA